MASISPFPNRHQARASSSKQSVKRPSTSNNRPASVDVVYQLVWMARPSDEPRTTLPSLRKGWLKSQGSIRISGPATDDSIWKADEPAPTQQKTPSSKDYESIYLERINEPRFTGPAADDIFWRRGEPISAQHQRPSIDHGSPYALGSLRITGEVADDSVWRRGESPSAQHQRPLIDYGSPLPTSNPRITSSAADNSVWRRGESPSAQHQKPLIDYGSPSPTSSPRIADPTFDRQFRVGDEPPLSWSQRLALEFAYDLPPGILDRVGMTDPAVNNPTSTAGEPSSSRSQRPLIDRAAARPPHNLPPRSLGNVRMTGPSANSSTSSKFQPGNNAPSAPMPQPTSGSKIPCMAKLHLDTLGALSTCSYDIATDSFSDFSVNDAAWGQRKGYRDHGDVQISTRKWSQGSWVLVKDDGGNEFLFVTVDRDHGIVRSWRPNLVAKRVVGGNGEMVKLTDGEFARLGCHEDDNF